MEPPFLPGAGADPICSEPKSAPGPRTSGAGASQKSGSFATLVGTLPPPPSWAYGAISFLGYSGTVFTQVMHSSTVFRNRVRITEDLLHCENWTFFHFFPPNSPFTDYGLVKQQLRENSVCLLAQICLCYIT